MLLMFIPCANIQLCVYFLLNDMCACTILYIWQGVACS